MLLLFQSANLYSRTCQHRRGIISSSSVTSKATYIRQGSFSELKKQDDKTKKKMSRRTPSAGRTQVDDGTWACSEPRIPVRERESIFPEHLLWEKKSHRAEEGRWMWIIEQCPAALSLGIHFTGRLWKAELQGHNTPAQIPRCLVISQAWSASRRLCFGLWSTAGPEVQSGALIFLLLILSGGGNPNPAWIKKKTSISQPLTDSPTLSHSGVFISLMAPAQTKQIRRCEVDLSCWVGVWQLFDWTNATNTKSKLKAVSENEVGSH